MNSDIRMIPDASAHKDGEREGPSPAGKSGRARIPADVWAALAIGLAAMVTRFLYCAAMKVPAFDPWRHLALIRNIRAGIGFSLFDGQPYIWYPPYWYSLCALFPERIAPLGIAAILSSLSVVVWFAWLRSPVIRCSFRTAVAIGALMAVFGPLVTFTCHYGAESFALFIMVVALAVTTRYPGLFAAACGGLLAGIAIVSRINFAPSLILFFPMIRSPRRAWVFIATLLVPVLLTWTRNHQILSSFPFVFVFDGLAVPSDSFNVLSTLLLQSNTDINEALLMLHNKIMRFPEWFPSPNSVLSFGPFIAVTVMLIAVSLSRKPHLIAAAVLGFSYYLFLDRSHSGYFFRVFLGLFPVLLAGTAYFLETPAMRGKRIWYVISIVGLIFLGGSHYLFPRRSLPLDAVTPPQGLLENREYLVNSGFYQPESILFRYPGSRLIGMPLRAGEFDHFIRHYPQYTAIVWHDFSIQDGLRTYLLSSGGYSPCITAVNSWNRSYQVLKRK